MKAGTKYWMGVRHVGDSDWPESYEELTAADMIRRLIKVLGEISLAKRLDVCIARTESECRLRLEERLQGSSGKKLGSDDSMMNEFERMCAELEAGDA